MIFVALMRICTILLGTILSEGLMHLCDNTMGYVWLSQNNYSVCVCVFIIINEHVTQCNIMAH